MAKFAHPNVVWVCGNGVNCSVQIMAINQSFARRYFAQTKGLLGRKF